ncbi:MAG: type II secretion system protein M [Steroidobacteraceae bacterium]
MNRAQLVQWYSALTLRDQRVLLIGGVVALLIALIGVFLPLQRNLAKAREELQTQQADLDWMREVGPTLAAAGSGPLAVATPESLAVLIDQSARESGLAKGIAGSQQAGNGALREQLQNVDFNSLAGWISRLSSQHGVRVEAATITSSNTPGIVNASVQFHTR